jgi:delta-1-pyrroline-5-carboxylate synthetase
MALYESMFGTYNVSCAQVLVTDSDFSNHASLKQFKATIESCLELGVVPIVNENDVISIRTTPLRDENDRIFWDNDSLACFAAAQLNVDAAFLLTDVEGLYDAPPDAPHSQVIHTYTRQADITFGAKSRVGRGGMQAKVAAAYAGIDNGVKAVVIASGYQRNTVLRLMKGHVIGTLFVRNPAPDIDSITERQAHAARDASRALQAVSSDTRTAILKLIAERLVENTDSILAANAKDVRIATASNMDSNLCARLKLTASKIATLADGIRGIAEDTEPIGRVVRQTQVADSLSLEQVTVPIGVLLIIFESRPDALPQIAALALRSGNGLLLKGGKEAQHSNALLHSIIVRAITDASNGTVPKEVVGLVNSRQAVSSLLKLDDCIDLVIPRGSGTLVKFIQTNTRIPVLGHADGICHLFVNHDADAKVAARVAVDAKTDYPAACNALETMLLHRSLVDDGRADSIISALKTAGVHMYGDDEACRRYHLKRVSSFRQEYGNLGMTVAIVRDVKEAVAHINKFGSGHTDSILSTDAEDVRFFLQQVDSACVFHNASTRFADGFRFGLGAEVGISTGKIHARGPVGVDGLVTTKWILQSSSHNGDIVSEFSNGDRKYLHISSKL